MEQHDEKPRTEYPRGRGYGHDYMRGGEVFGGYGYREREEYERRRGGPAGESPAATDTSEATGREPVGERGEDRAADVDSSQSTPGVESSGAAHHETAGTAHGEVDPARPLLERTYGSTGGNLRHSRSFYVTQAQLQQRIYGPQRYGQGPYHDRLRTIVRDDDEMKRDVEERLFFDTWVDSDRIAVRVNNGIVTLSGTLPSYQEIRYACDDAWAVAGVRGVHSELRISGEEGAAESAAG